MVTPTNWIALTTTALMTVAAAPDGCQTDAPRHKVCEVNTRGIEVEDYGESVADVVTVTCEVSPVSHRLETWLEYSTSRYGGWTMPRFPRSSGAIPDSVEGVSLRVTLPCREGYYRTAWRTTGAGPELPDHPDGIPFDVVDGDFGSTAVTAEQCERG